MKKFLIKILNDKRLLLGAILIIGIIMFSLSSIKIGNNYEVNTDMFSDITYINKLQIQLEDIISSIEGAGESKVMINVSSSSETLYVKENKNSYNTGDNKSTSESEDSVLTMRDGQGNEHVVITKQLMPKIAGVTVVCEGGNDIFVRSNIIEAVATVLDISVNKVCVIAKAN